MDLLLCILSMLRKMAWTLPVNSSSRGKLQKKRRGQENISKICSRDVLDAVRKSSLGLCLQSQEALGLMAGRFTSPEPPLQRVLNHHSSTVSNTSASLYSIDQMQQQNLRRTRPKTPILHVGQREDVTARSHGISRELAANYQAVLPTREIGEDVSSQHQPLRKLRKVKSQISLRDLSRDQADGRVRIPTMDSDGDVDTLVGSEPPSPNSKIHDEFWRIPSIRKASYPSTKSSKGDSDIGLQICVDLLTNELASILFRHHPAEDNDRASELQILLMIEAYETIQRQIHENQIDSSVTANHMSRLEQLLESWLDVLYDLYERSRACNEQNFKCFDPTYLTPSPMNFTRAQVPV
ncbi:hypothetical protein GcM1_244010 [Golovinomyces cichoracearum]|uniref:Mating-type switching protein swi10 n=1 Tax=Golovinomyces cichoracearum TaxID=62708 RepID=A0A420IFN9_9PEZI|nr:hypothetical protein GcM1_244010 [Golovinomyces cichoracearum]